ncbi:hypothetical protein Trisim1_004735 [Trichoderma cf. simile WF8]
MHIRHHDSPHPSICRAQDPKAGQGSIVNQPRSFWRQARGARRSTHGLVRRIASITITVSTRCWAIRSTGDRDGLEIGTSTRTHTCALVALPLAHWPSVSGDSVTPLSSSHHPIQH